jgi:hypothetical protein
MRSSRDGIGLALLRLDAVEAGQPFVAGEATLRPVDPAEPADRSPAAS